MTKTQHDSEVLADGQQGTDDIEFVMIRKGFDLLEGGRPAFA